VQVETDCGGCIFADTDPHEGMAQIGCRLGRLEAFARNGGEVRTVKDERAGLDRFAVKGRFCNAKRDMGWLVRNASGPREAVLAELFLPPDLIVVVPTGKTLDDLARSVDSVPERGSLCVVHNSDDLSYGAVRLWMAERLKGDARPWFTTYVIERPRPGGLLAVDRTFGRVNSQFYLYLPAGEVAPKDLARWVHHKTNVQMERLALVYPAEGGWYLAQSGLHRVLGGNEPSVDEVEAGGEKGLVELPNLPAKIQFMADQNGLPDLARQYGA
jgi:hypothetical protein